MSPLKTPFALTLALLAALAGGCATSNARLPVPLANYPVPAAVEASCPTPLLFNEPRRTDADAMRREAALWRGLYQICRNAAMGLPGYLAAGVAP